MEFQNDKIWNSFFTELTFLGYHVVFYHKASLQAKIIKRQQKYIIVISIHKVVDGNPNV